MLRVDISPITRFVCLLAALLLLAGCGVHDTIIVRETSAGQARGEIVIGVAWPFASNDGGFSDGLELAVAEINSKGGVKDRRIRLWKKDDEGLVTKGMAIAQEFAAANEVVAVIGHRNSYVTEPASSIYEEAGLVMLTPGSTAPAITEQGFRYVFRSVPSDALIAREIASFAAQRGHKRFAIYYTNDAYGRGLANAFEDSATAAGMAIVDRVSHYADHKELLALVNRWKALAFDGLFIADTASSAAKFIAAVRKAGVNVPIYGGNAMDSATLALVAGQAAEGTVVGTMFDIQDPRPEAQAFSRAFHAKYGRMPNQWAAQGYDAVKLLTAAMERVGTTQPSLVAAALRTFKQWPGAAGLHTIDETGDERGSMVVKRVVRNGKLETLR